MQKLHFEATINASPEKVWNAVIDDKKFREWTSAFNESSYFEGGWEKGDKIRFLAKGENGEKMGMISEIAESQKYSFISIRHLGYIRDGKEDISSDEVKRWAPAYENYSLRKSGNSTLFEVDVDTEDRYVGMFNEMWPNAIRLLKNIAER